MDDTYDMLVKVLQVGGLQQLDSCQIFPLRRIEEALSIVKSQDIDDQEVEPVEEYDLLGSSSLALVRGVVDHM